MIDPELELKINEIYRRLEAQEIIVTQNKGHLYLSANMTGLAVSTKTIIEYDLWNFNCNNAGINSYGAVVQERGIYLITQAVLWVDLAATSRACSSVEINGADVDWDHQHCVKQANVGTRNVVMAECNVGDIIKGYYWHDSGGNPHIDGTNKINTYLQFHLISRQCK